MDELSRYVPNVKFELIPIRNLVSNQDYQRSLSIGHIERTAANFDPYQINPVKVSRRDGINYVFNGQHTIEIVALASGSRDTPVWCMVYDELCYEHEADIFANQQKFVKPLLPYEVYLANLEAQNSDQLMIEKILRSYSLSMGIRKGPGVICAVSTIESIYKKYGYHTLDRVLRLCIGAWEGDMNSFGSNVLNGVTKLVTVYGDNLIDEVFKEKVGAIPIKTLSRTAKERHAGSLGYAEAMVIAYNGKKKSPAQRLPMRKLYTKESSIFAALDDEESEEVLEDELSVVEDEESLF